MHRYRRTACVLAGVALTTVPSWSFPEVSNEREVTHKSESEREAEEGLVRRPITRVLPTRPPVGRLARDRSPIEPKESDEMRLARATEALQADFEAAHGNVAALGRIATGPPLGTGLQRVPTPEETNVRANALKEALALVPKATATREEVRKFLARNPGIEGIDVEDGAATVYLQDENPRRVLRLPKNDAAPHEAAPLSRGGILSQVQHRGAWAPSRAEFPGFGEIDWQSFRPYYESRLRNQVSEASSKGLSFMAIDPTGHSPSVFFPNDKIQVSKDDWEQLSRGMRLSPEHSLSQRLAQSKVHVITSSPLVARAESPLTKINDASIYALQKSYPEILFVRDPPGEETNKRVADLAALEQRIPESVVAVIADKSFKVRDGKLIQNIQTTLQEQGVSVQTFGGAKPKVDAAGGSIVIAISGHIDEQLVAFVRSLGHSGALRGNFVLLTSCEAKASRDLQAEIVQQFGATASFAYQGILHASDLDPFLVDLATTLKKERSAVQPRRAAPTSHFAHRGFTKILRDTLRAHGLNGVWVATRVNYRSLVPTETRSSAILFPRSNPERRRHSPNEWG